MEENKKNNELKTKNKSAKKFLIIFGCIWLAIALFCGGWVYRIHKQETWIVNQRLEGKATYFDPQLGVERTISLTINFKGDVYDYEMTISGGGRYHKSGVKKESLDYEIEAGIILKLNIAGTKEPFVIKGIGPNYYLATDNYMEGVPLELIGYYYIED